MGRPNFVIMDSAPRSIDLRDRERSADVTYQDRKFLNAITLEWGIKSLPPLATSPDPHAYSCSKRVKSAHEPAVASAPCVISRNMVIADRSRSPFVISPDSMEAAATQ